MKDKDLPGIGGKEFIIVLDKNNFYHYQDVIVTHGPILLNENGEETWMYQVKNLQSRDTKNTHLNTN